MSLWSIVTCLNENSTIDSSTVWSSFYHNIYHTAPSLDLSFKRFSKTLTVSWDEKYVFHLSLLGCCRQNYICWRVLWLFQELWIYQGIPNEGRVYPKFFSMKYFHLKLLGLIAYWRGISQMNFCSYSCHWKQADFDFNSLLRFSASPLMTLNTIYSTGLVHINTTKILQTSSEFTRILHILIRILGLYERL